MISYLPPEDIHDTLTPLIVEALIGPVSALIGQARLGIAVSGGADSFAALNILRRYFPPRQLICLTVDHGLRAGSAREAMIVARWCQNAGIHHETLIWTAAEKPTCGLQAAARQARYRLLAAACHQHKLRFLVTGHQADDQAETLLMHLKRGAGVEGISGMAPASQIAAGPLTPVTMLRPFLGVTRTAIQTYANAQGLPIQADPGNQDRDYERIRIRQSRQDGGGNSDTSGSVISTQALCRTASRQLHARRDLEAQCFEDFVAARGVIVANGAACLDDLALKALPLSRQMRLMRRLCHAVSGRRQAPAQDKAVNLTAQLNQKHCASLGGVLFWRHQAHEKNRHPTHPGSSAKLWVLREPAALLGRAGVKPIAGLKQKRKEPLLWDNRFVIGRDPEPHAALKMHRQKMPYRKTDTANEENIGEDNYVIYPLGRYFGTVEAQERARGSTLGSGIGLDAAGQEIFTPQAILGKALAFNLVATLPAGFIGMRCCAIPSAAKNSVIMAGGPWRRSFDTLHVHSLVEERFFRPVNRF